MNEGFGAPRTRGPSNARGPLSGDPMTLPTASRAPRPAKRPGKADSLLDAPGPATSRPTSFKRRSERLRPQATTRQLPGILNQSVLHWQSAVAVTAHQRRMPGHSFATASHTARKPGSKWTKLSTSSVLKTLPKNGMSRSGSAKKSLPPASQSGKSSAPGGTDDRSAIGPHEGEQHALDRASRSLSALETVAGTEHGDSRKQSLMSHKEWAWGLNLILEMQENSVSVQHQPGWAQQMHKRVTKIQSVWRMALGRRRWKRTKQLVNQERKPLMKQATWGGWKLKNDLWKIDETSVEVGSISDESSSSEGSDCSHVSDLSRSVYDSSDEDYWLGKYSNWYDLSEEEREALKARERGKLRRHIRGKAMQEAKAFGARAGLCRLDTEMRRKLEKLHGLAHGALDGDETWYGSDINRHRALLKAAGSIRRNRLAAFSIQKTKQSVEQTLHAMMKPNAEHDVRRGTMLTKWRLAMLRGVIDKHLLKDVAAMQGVSEEELRRLTGFRVEELGSVANGQDSNSVSRLKAGRRRLQFLQGALENFGVQIDSAHGALKHQISQLVTEGRDQQQQPLEGYKDSLAALAEGQQHLEELSAAAETTALRNSQPTGSRTEPDSHDTLYPQRLTETMQTGTRQGRACLDTLGLQGHSGALQMAPAARLSMKQLHELDPVKQYGSHSEDSQYSAHRFGVETILQSSDAQSFDMDDSSRFWATEDASQTARTCRMPHAGPTQTSRALMPGGSPHISPGRYKPASRKAEAESLPELISGKKLKPGTRAQDDLRVAIATERHIRSRLRQL